MKHLETFEYISKTLIKSEVLKNRKNILHDFIYTKAKLRSKKPEEKLQVEVLLLS